MLSNRIILVRVHQYSTYLELRLRNYI